MAEATCTPDPPVRATGAGSCVLVGAALGLACVAVSALVLRPTLDRAAPAHVVAATAGLLVGLGAWLGRADAGRPRGLIVAGLVTGLGGSLLYAFAPGLNPLLASMLRREGVGALYHPLVAAATVLAAGPLLIPLGMILATALCSGARRELPLVLVAFGLAFLTAPYLGDALLGPRTLVAVAAVLGLAASIQMASYGERVRPPWTLGPGAALALPLLGAALATGVRQLHVHAGSGVLGAPWAVGVAALTAGTALAVAPRALAIVPRGAVYGLVALVIATLAFAFPLEVPIRGLATHDPLADLLDVVTVGAPVGLALGLVLCARGGGPDIALAPALVAILLPLVPLVLVPRLGPHVLLAALGAATLALALPTAGARALASAALLLLVATAGPVLLAPLVRAAALGAPVITTQRETQDGHLAFVHDPLTGRRALAIDGRAPLGRTAEHERRLVHLPLLLAPPARRVLLVSSEGGDWIDAALAHAPEQLEWLTPFPPALAPTVARLGELVHADPPVLRPHAGSERLFFAGQTPRFDAIVLAPDPRVATRGQLVSTVEFYEEVRAHLTDDGVFCQWWDLSATDVSDVKRVIASLHEVFDEPYLLLDHPRSRAPVVGLIGRRRPLSVSPRRVDERLAALPEVAADVAAIGIDGLLIACMVSADRGVLEILAPREGRLLDARPALAVRTAFARRVQPAALADAMTTFAARRRAPTPWLDTSEEDHLDLVRLPLTLRQLDRAWMHMIGGAQAVVREGGAAGSPPFDAELPAQLPDVEADKLLEALPCRHLHASLVPIVAGYARALLEREGAVRAERYLRKAIEKAEASGELYYELARVVERRGDPQDAARLYRSALWFDPYLAAARDALVLLGEDPDAPADQGASEDDEVDRGD